jgi:hypothetical protein
MMIIITVCQLRKYLPIVIIEIKVTIIEIAPIEFLNNQRGKITFKKNIGHPIRIKIKHLRIQGMILKNLLIKKRVIMDINSPQEENKKLKGLYSISVRLQSLEIKHLIKLMSKNIKVKGIKDQIIGSNRCLKGDQEKITLMELMEEDHKINMNVALKRQEMNQIIIGNLKKRKNH